MTSSFFLSSSLSRGLMEKVRVGVAAVLLSSDGKMLIGKRKGSHGAGKYQTPGGHLEFGESFEACATREVLEETGLPMINCRFIHATNDYMQEEGKHYVTVFVLGHVPKDCSEMPQVMEPEKCEFWKWMSEEEFRDLPDDLLFLPMLNIKRNMSRILS